MQRKFSGSIPTKLEDSLHPCTVRPPNLQIPPLVLCLHLRAHATCRIFEGKLLFKNAWQLRRTGAWLVALSSYTAGTNFCAPRALRVNSVVNPQIAPILLSTILLTHWLINPYPDKNIPQDINATSKCTSINTPALVHKPKILTTSHKHDS